MPCRLSELATTSLNEDLPVLRGVDPVAVARLNGVAPELFAGVRTPVGHWQEWQPVGDERMPLRQR